jgi:hypothetical protein
MKPKEIEKQHLIDMMKDDEDLGLYEINMQTPQEKAKKLISMYSITILSEVGNKLTMYEVKQIAKQCALLSADEVLSTLYDYHYDSESGAYDYWQEVKQELEQSK